MTHIIVIGSDHSGYYMKECIKNFLLEERYNESKIEIIDVGCNNPKRCDYPDIAERIQGVIKEHGDKLVTGIAICGTGNGIGMSLNRYRHIRAAVCHNHFTAEMSRKHNDANVITLGARVISNQEAYELVDIFLTTLFEGGRHLGRIEKFST